MKSREQMEDMLYEKAYEEQEAFEDRLKGMSPDDIMDRAYQLVIQEDILMTFESPGYLSDRCIAALLEIDNVLESCYNDWLDNDYSHMESLRASVEGFADCYANSKEALL